jgi:hypothetical protein
MAMTVPLVLLALAGLVSIAAAAFLVALPLGLLVAGVEALAAAYVIRYLGVRDEVTRRAR